MLRLGQGILPRHLTSPTPLLKAPYRGGPPDVPKRGQDHEQRSAGSAAWGEAPGRRGGGPRAIARASAPPFQATVVLQTTSSGRLATPHAVSGPRHVFPSVHAGRVIIGGGSGGRRLGTDIDARPGLKHIFRCNGLVGLLQHCFPRAPCGLRALGYACAPCAGSRRRAPHYSRAPFCSAQHEVPLWRGRCTVAPRVARLSRKSAQCRCVQPAQHAFGTHTDESFVALVVLKHDNFDRSLPEPGLSCRSVEGHGPWRGRLQELTPDPTQT